MRQRLYTLSDTRCQRIRFDTRMPTHLTACRIHFDTMRREWSRVMKKHIKRSISIASVAVGYTFILAAIYVSAISYMYRAGDDDKH